MADLIAQGEKPDDHWRRSLPLNRSFILGRAAGEWAIPWERWASGSHAEAIWTGEQLRIHRLPSARNPMFFRGEATDAATIATGECFAIGLTVFTLSGDTGSGSGERLPIVVQERTVSADELTRVPFQDAPRRLDVLRRLPKVIASAEDEDLFAQLVNLLLAGVPRADVIAIVAHDKNGVATIHAESRRFGDVFQPSRRLVREALTRQQRTVLHVWAESANLPPGADGRTFTMQANLDWAFCTPLRGADANWGIYVAGRMTGDATTTVTAPLTESDLTDDFKFVELTAEIFVSLRQVRRLQRDQARLNQFFSPAVQKALTSGEPEQVLRPRETDVTVMFCDLRGFSAVAEAEAEQLLRLLERVSHALGVMTQNILDQHGVVADFLGDAALGFWGWPLSDAAMAQQACRAALGIRRYYSRLDEQPEHPLAGFRVGIGIATGRAVAGRIGTHEQAKVTVFGPVVNLASRLESMTKLLHVPILLDEATAEAARTSRGPDGGRVRRLARVRPYGLETPLTVCELLPPAEQGPTLSDSDVASYEHALDAFLAGRWDDAMDLLHSVSPRDRGKDTLISYIIARNHTPPADWDGVISLDTK